MFGYGSDKITAFASLIPSCALPYVHAFGAQLNVSLLLTDQISSLPAATWRMKAVATFWR